MTREGDEHPPKALIRRTARYAPPLPGPDSNDPEKAAAKLWHEAAEKLITGGRCPVHSDQWLTHPALGHPALGRGSCEDCAGYWSYSPRTRVVFIGPTRMLPSIVWGSAIPERPACTLGSNGFGLYLAAETIGQFIDLAELLDNTPFADEDAIEVGKKILRMTEAGTRILFIAAAMALGRRLGYGR